MHRHLITVAFAALTALPAVSQASFVQATFNDLTVGSIYGQTGGTGFASGSTWTTNASSSVIRVVAGNLSAPASTNFALTQTDGSPRSTEAYNTTPVERIRSRALESSMTGTVWISFLINVANSGETAGISLNSPAGFTQFSLRPALFASGTSLIYDPDRTDQIGTGEEAVSANSIFTLGMDALVLARLTIKSDEPSTLDAWVNPTLIADGFLPTPTLSIASVGIANTVTGNFDNLTFLDRIAIGATSTSSSSGGNLDLLTLSNNANGAFEVTGVNVAVPEPAAISLLGLLPALSRRRR